ncbi:HEAT repeat domain-containing protein [Larkinella soli]|uniref:HEAT repeat domain-containing protein n=1 Tax=Larkinella soli TaxID=1770527 RepID=UPI000FFB1D44|nr:HEAT repeat domain-containing protein [Larkinella soli]
MKPDIEKLLERYYEGETTLEEEKLLREFFRSEAVPAHLKDHAAPFQHYTDFRQEHPSPAVGSRFADRVGAESRIRPLVRWGLRVAAGLTLLLLGFFGGMLYSARTSPAGEGQTASAAEDLKTVLRYDRVMQTSASERIQAVYQSMELDRADQEITLLLVNALNSDANVNVRLAACQALLRFRDEPGVREALIQSLKVQTDPNVQISLIEALVVIREKRAAREIQRMARNEQIIKAVRMKAEEGLSRLI